MGEGAKPTQLIRYLLQELGLPEGDAQAPLLSGSKGATGWASSGRKAPKRARRENARELRAAEQKCAASNAGIRWISSKESNAGLLAKERAGKGHYAKLRGATAFAREPACGERAAAGDDAAVAAPNASKEKPEGSEEKPSWAMAAKRSRKCRSTSGSASRALKAAPMMGGARNAFCRAATRKVGGKNF